MHIARARAQGMELLGPGGRLMGLSSRGLETTAVVELSEHLGYDEQDPAARNCADSRNDTRAKTVLTGSSAAPRRFFGPKQYLGQLEQRTSAGVQASCGSPCGTVRAPCGFRQRQRLGSHLTRGREVIRRASRRW